MKNNIAVQIDDFLSAKPGAAIIIGDIIINAGHGMHKNVTTIVINRFILD